MGMPAQETEWTAEMARSLPDDGKRYEVLDGERSIVFDQAENRLHAQKAILEQLLGPRG